MLRREVLVLSKTVYSRLNPFFFTGQVFPVFIFYDLCGRQELFCNN